MLDLLPASTQLADVRRGITIDRRKFAAACSVRCEELRGASLGEGDRLGICHRDSLALLIDLFSAWQIGAAVVPLSASLLSNERKRAADRFALSVWVSDQPLPSVKSLAPAEYRSSTGTSTISAARTNLDSPCLILSTSGTTAEPKGVVLTRRALMARIALNIEWINADVLQRTLVTLPLHFGHGLIGNALTPLLAGGTLYLWTEPALEGLATLGALLDEHEITFLSSVPSMWRVALRVSKRPLRNSLRRIHVGSEPLPSDLWRAIANWAGERQVFNMYGISEAANWICGEDGASCDFVLGTVGRPWGGSVRIKQDERGELTESGRGEILVSTPGLMACYWQDKEGTAAALDGGWFRTGDIGELDSNGRLRVVGRIKHQINRGGIKISAEEIDALLRSHPDVEDACAFALPDPIAGEVVAAVVVAKQSADIDLSELVRWCSERVRAEAVPHKIATVDKLPRTERGKVRRDAVKDLFLSIQRAKHDEQMEARAANPSRN